MKRILFITGTDTGVGKTVLTCLLVRFLREQGVNAAALKPICSGRRDDAQKIHAAMDGAVPLDEINPWHFRAPVAPVLAARREKKTIRRPQLIAHLRAMQKRFEVLIVEGAGGLLSPLGEGFDSRDLIRDWRATPIVVAANKLGVVNHLRLTLEALPKAIRCRAGIVLMASPQPDASAATNAALLAEFFPARRIFLLPRLGKSLSSAAKSPRVLLTLAGLLRD